MRKIVCFSVLFVLMLMASTAAQASGKRVVAIMHGMNLGQGEAGGGPLYEDYTAGGKFAISHLNGAVIVTVPLESWSYADDDHIVSCGPVIVIKNDLGLNLPTYVCTTPVPISGFAVYSDFDGDGHNDYKEWVRLLQ